MNTDRQQPERIEQSRSWPGSRPHGREQIRRVLVVVDDATLAAPERASSPLLKRAARVAGATQSELELFYVSHDETLDQHLFAADEQVTARKLEVLDRDATRLAELALWLETSENIQVSHDTRWDWPWADAILRKVQDAQPDLVMKASTQDNYFVGMFSNTDWELLRRSPAHLWFVTTKDSELSRVVSAIGSAAPEEPVLGDADYRICELASLLTDGLGARHEILHTYQAPTSLTGYAAYAPEFGRIAPLAVDAEQQQRRAVAEEHGRMLAAFAQYFGLDESRIHLRQGRVADVLPHYADSARADLIIMGARSLGRFERFRKTLNAEPVLAQAPCDVVIVRDRDAAMRAPDPLQPPAHGLPAIDLEQAIVDPGLIFRSPAELVERTDLSRAMRKRILKIWETDIRSEMTEEDEGGPVQRSKAELLASLHRHIQALDTDPVPTTSETH